MSLSARNSQLPKDMNQPTSSPDTTNRAVTRYKDAYLVARAVTAIGKSVKYMGVMLGLIVIAVGYYVGTQMGGGLMYSVGGAVAGVVISIPLYLLGILVSSQGQVLKASLDVAVHTSPFLEAEQKARVMSLD